MSQKNGKFVVRADSTFYATLPPPPQFHPQFSSPFLSFAPSLLRNIRNISIKQLILAGLVVTEQCLWAFTSIEHIVYGIFWF